MLWWISVPRMAIFVVPEFIVEAINLFNISSAGLVIVVIMLYFSRTINQKDEALVQANTKLEERNQEISAQHQRLQILIKEIHHRVKNNLQIISSLMSLQGRTVEDVEVASVLNESRRRVEAIALIHQKLYQDDNANRVDFKSYLEELISSQQKINRGVKCEVELKSAVLNLDIAVPLGLIISELITNSMKHAFVDVGEPKLEVKLEQENEEYVLAVKDNGVGLPDEFDLEHPVSLGIEIISALSDQIGAKVKYTNDCGAKFTVRFKDVTPSRMITS
jgi:two-component sensor histidine kinase